MFGNISGDPRIKTRNHVYNNTCQQTLKFQGTFSMFAQNHSVRFLSVWTLKILAYSAPIENGKKFHQRIIDACQSIRNCPRDIRRGATIYDQTYVHACVITGAADFNLLVFLLLNN